MKYKNIREEELKNKIGADWFKSFDTTEIVGDIDFTVFQQQGLLFGRTPLLWAEAKVGDFDIPTMFVQLILTIGKARTFDKTLPPAFLGAFDFKKIAFVPYLHIQDIFYLNDFNWKVTPSNHSTKEFKLIKERIETILKKNSYIYDYTIDEKELKHFIANNIANATETSKIKIDKNNFIPIYLRWLDTIKPIIDVNWDDLTKANILDSDFYLADLFVDDRDTSMIDDDTSIKDSLFVIFQNQGYKIAKENIRQMFDATINIRKKEVYQQFWKRYKRPPIKEFQNYIIERRDLLVPQDIRERKGAFFTPRQWVELSQKYLCDLLGESWQEEYFIWDCAAGTGNLLAGLTNKYNIWASTLDQADVKVMHDRINQGANLLESHVFQFDFLNDNFAKLPQGLQEIIKDDDKRKKLIIYINPPYAEAGTGQGKQSKAGVALNHKAKEKYKVELGKATNEIFAQFLIRIYKETPGCIIANFSTLKNLQSSNFKIFRNHFQAKLEKLFISPANTFDNVKGEFPIGFFIWNTKAKEHFLQTTADVFNKNGNFIGIKNIYSYDNLKNGKINDWLRKYYDKSNDIIGIMHNNKTDFQHNNQVVITSDDNKDHTTPITKNNLIVMSMYLAVRKVIPATWLNDRDQFLHPNENYKTDKEFQNDCLAYTLFNNNIQTKFGVNHWIPFTENEVNAKEKFESNFMTDFIKGKLNTKIPGNLFDNEIISNKVLQFSQEAIDVFNAGRELWRYYHTQKDINVNASLYDIKSHFQGRNAKGRMNAKSTDERYVELISNMRQTLSILADKIAPKVYEYEFLKH